MAPSQVVLLKDLLVSSQGSWVEFGPLHFTVFVFCFFAGLIFVGLGLRHWAGRGSLWPEIFILLVGFSLSGGVLLGRSLQFGGGIFYQSRIFGWLLPDSLFT